MLEAEERTDGAGGESGSLLRALREELDRNGAFAMDTVYVRGGVISGPALNDSFHFGQTWINDQGRPFGRGFNAYTGFTAHAESGRFLEAAQAEFQRAPGGES
jgi:hypothetical protein